MTTRSGTSPATASSHRDLVEDRLRLALQRGRQTQTIPRRTTSEAIPLSYSQWKMWFQEQLVPGQPTYNVPLCLHLEGELHVAILESSLIEILRRHEALRTTLEPTGGGVMQKIHPVPKRILETVDLRFLPAERGEEENRSILYREARRPFDLASGPLLRVVLVRLSGSDNLMMNFHHAIIDGWSTGLLFRELQILYKAYLEGQPSPLAELPLQYADYAIWQKETYSSGDLEKDLVFWKHRLSGLAMLELFPDHPRPSVQSNRGTRYQFKLPDEFHASLMKLAQQEEVTLYVLLLSAFAVLLMRYTGQEDIAVGSPLANRRHSESEGLIGLFVNTLVMRNDLSGDPAFRDFLQCTHQMALKAFAHQDFPLEKLMEEVASGRDLSRAPLYQVMFGLQNAPMSLFALPRLRTRQISIDNGTAKFEWLLLLEEERGLEGVLEYNIDLFDHATVERVILHYETLLRSIAANPALRLSQLQLLSNTELRQLCEEWPQNTTGYPRQATVHALFMEQVRQFPNKVAVEDGDRTLAYIELERRANRLSHHLKTLGVTQESRVGVCLERSSEFVVVLLAILKAGGAYVPLDPEHPAERLNFIVKDAGIKVLLSRSELSRKLAELQVRIVWLDQEEEALAGYPDSAVPLSGTADNLAYAIYTSGSTGEPKAVGVPHRGIVRLVMDTDYVDITPDDVMGQVSTTTFDAATFEIWGALLRGARLAVVTREKVLSPRDLAEELGRRKITILFLTTALFNQTVRDEPAAFQGLKTLLFGGEMVEPVWAQTVLEASPPARLLHVYGPTENTTFSTWHQIRDVAAGAKNIPIGRSIANSQCYVLDRFMNPVPTGVPGELFLGGDGLSRGYLNRPDLTAPSFVPNSISSAAGSRLYRTGDRVRQLADGSIEFLGRLDNQIKLRGFRIEVGEIEHVLGQHPQVRDRAVLAKRGRDTQMRLVAYVAVEGRPDTNSLRAFVSRKLPAYMVPAAFITLDALPLNANGKVDRRALEKLDDSQMAVDKQVVPPRNRVEEILVEIWAQELNVKKVGIDENFFELGGHSLLATKLIARVRQAFGSDIPLRRLFEAPTIAEFGAFLDTGDDRRNSSSPLPVIVPDKAGRNRPFPLTDIQEAYFMGRSAAFELGNVGTHIYIEINCAALDLELLEIAWQRVIARHEMLRAVILEDGEQQILLETPLYRIEVADFMNAPANIAQEGLQSIRERLSQQVFNPARWPLFEIRASCMPANRIHLHLSLDALVCDAWSLQIIFSDLLTFYRAPLTQLPAIDLSFRDYVLAEVALHESALYQRSLEYWQGRVDSLPASPDLPLAVSPGGLQQRHFVRRRFTLPAAEWSRIKDRSTRAGLTPSVVLLTAFADVLSTWSKNPRFTLNLTLFHRLPLHPQVDQVVGDFTSLNLLEVDCTVRDNFEARGRRLQKRLWDDLDHRYVSGVRVMRELARRRGGMVTMPVVFTSMLSFTDSGQDAGALLEQLGELSHGITQTPQVWLDHQVVESNGTLEFNWDALPELFPPGMLDDMYAAYCGLLHDLASTEDAWTALHNSLVPAYQLKEREAVNATSAPVAAQTLHELFQIQAAARPEGLAILSSRRELTYAELARESHSLAALLQQRGVTPNTLIAVVMEKGWEQVVAVLGILQAGAAYLPIDPAYPTERVAYLLRHGQAKLALTQPWLVKKIEWPSDVEPVALDSTMLARNTAPVKDIANSESLAYVIYTSGSTGLPKGVMIDHRGAVNTILDINQRFAVSPQDRVLALSSLSFDLSVYDIFGTLAAGGSIVFPDDSGVGRDPLHWLELLRRYGVTIWNSVPALIELMVEQARVAPSQRGHRLRLVMLSGDWIPILLPQQVQALFSEAQVISLGGATEASIWSILYPIGEVPAGWKSIPYGKPMVNQTFHVLRNTLEPSPVWVPGELFIGGVGVALGYWQDQERTRASFIVHPGTGERLYRTGDLGRYLPDGNIEFLGREDFQIKVHGYRVELGEIEAALTGHSEVLTAVVVAKGKAQERRLVAYFVPRQIEAPPEESVLRTFLESALPRYMVPSSFVMLPALPLSANGKVDRGALPDPKAQNQMSVAAACDERLVRLVKSILKKEDIAPEANILSLGATSIDVIRIVNQVQREFGFRPDIRVFYDHPSIAALARLVAAHEGAPEAAPRLAPVSPVEKFKVLLDPDEREAFKKRRLGLRSHTPHISSVSLPPVTIGTEGSARFLSRRTHRSFARECISQQSLANLLRWLGPVWVDGAEKYLYPSAGSLYAVQTYLHLKPGAVKGLAAGAYYYHPVNHTLLCLMPGAEIDARIHEPRLNRPIFEQAGFSIFLVARLNAIAPLYGEYSQRFASLEAGHMGQVLMSFAPENKIALCPIGDVEFEPLRAMFDLDEDHVLMHLFVGGPMLAAAAEHAADVSGVKENRGREEWEL